MRLEYGSWALPIPCGAASAMRYWSRHHMSSNHATLIASNSVTPVFWMMAIRSSQRSWGWPHRAWTTPALAVAAASWSGSSACAIYLSSPANSAAAQCGDGGV